MEVYLIVAVITFIFSFGVQFAVFLWFHHTKNSLLDDFKSVVAYSSGIVGDAVLMPLTNIFGVLTLRSISWNAYPQTVMWSFIGGVFITFVFHFGQQYFRLTNWTMPQVGYWNKLGIYHAFFMFFESSFLCFVVINFFFHGDYHGLYFFVVPPISYGFYGLIIFFITFAYDYWHDLFKPQFLRLRPYKRG